MVNISVDASSLGLDFGGNYTLEGEEVLSAGLDLVGIIDPTGVADAANAVLQAKNGDWFGATISVVSLVPGVGDLSKVAKIGDDIKTLQKGIDAVRTQQKAVGASTNVIPNKAWKNKIEGTAQNTGTPGHQTRSYRIAIENAKKPDVEKVYLDKGYNKVAGLPPGTIKPNRRPDVSVVKKDGKIDVYEVASKTDKPAKLQQRNQKAMNQLPSHMQGKVKVVSPTKSR